MSTEQNKAIARRLNQAFDTNDQATLDELLAPDLMAHFPGMPTPLNREAFLQVVGLFTAAFNDNHTTTDDQIAEGDKVMTHITWRAVHSGDFQGIPATGKQIAVTGIAIERIQDGKIVEHWSNLDQLSLMQQLGVIPAPGQGG
jgi:steroid delta-isomerase-like uncharacterized protein